MVKELLARKDHGIQEYLIKETPELKQTLLCAFGFEVDWGNPMQSFLLCPKQLQLIDYMVSVSSIAQNNNVI